MQTKWHFYIWWSVFSLNTRHCLAVDDESPSSARSASRQKEIEFELSDHENPELKPGPRFHGPGSHGVPRSPPHVAYVPDVSVTCSASDFEVRVKSDFYGLGASSDELRLGTTCPSNGRLVERGDLLFTYRLTECDVQREVT